MTDRPRNSAGRYIAPDTTGAPSPSKSALYKHNQAAIAAEKARLEQRQLDDAMKHLRTGETLASAYAPEEYPDAPSEKKLGKRKSATAEAEQRALEEAEAASRVSQTPDAMERHRQTVRQEVSTQFKRHMADINARIDTRFDEQKSNTDAQLRNIVNTLLNIQEVINRIPTSAESTSHDKINIKEISDDEIDDDEPPTVRYNVKSKDIGFFNPAFQGHLVISTSEGEVYTDVYDFIEILMDVVRMFGAVAVLQLWPRCLKGGAHAWWSYDLNFDIRAKYYALRLDKVCELLIGQFKIHIGDTIQLLGNAKYDLHDVRAGIEFKSYARDVIRYAKAAQVGPEI